MNSIKSIFLSIAFLLLAVGFFVMIYFETKYGLAGGKFGGVELINMPGTFWFFILLQTGWGVSFIIKAIKILSNNRSKSVVNHQENITSTSYLIAIYRLLQVVFLTVLILMGLWAVFEITSNFYKMIIGLKMPDQAIISVLAFFAVMVFCFVIYYFGLLTLIENIYPKARDSFRLLQKKVYYKNNK